MDYDASMKYWFSSIALVWATAGVCAEPPIENSKLNAVLFYQLLLGELNVQAGEPGAGFAIILDAARKTKDEALYQRATELALQSRSGEAALQAARSWKSSLPESQEANRYILQILLALNRIEEAGRALKTSIASLPLSEQSNAIGSIPRVFSRVQDKNFAAKIVEQALSGAIQNPETAATAWTTIGRMKRDAGEIQPAAEAARAGHAANRRAPGPIMLALSLLNFVPDEVQPMISQYMSGDALPDLRLGYARTLIDLNQMQLALAQLNQLTKQQPEFAAGWLFLGLLQSDLSQVLQAEQSLQQYIQLASKASDPDKSGGLYEAYLSLSQMAQKQGRLTQADEWLAKIPPGVWRDRAYAEYSQVALHVYNNSRASRWALDQIADDDFKKEAGDFKVNSRTYRVCETPHFKILYMKPTDPIDIGELAGGAALGLVGEDGDAMTGAAGFEGEHAAELAAAEDTDGRRGRELHALGSTSSSFWLSRTFWVWRSRKVFSFSTSSGLSFASMETAKSPAFRAPALPMAKVATGMPPGIWTME